ncbi:unnamed protein product [Meganyctiphanes norvegica]|uniref:EGF-like domain-containing protein n=1 Tax=Meganyctiphanes norvegica TaxID=48144 RepID=A0AAV2RXW9_MEGNR
MESKGIFLCTIIFLSVVTVKYSYAKLPYGSPCTNEIQCQGIVSQYDVKYSDCKNGRCNCSFSQRLQFTNNNYECQHILYGDTVTCEPDDNSTCINGVCKNEILSSNCICNDGFIMSGKTCREILSVDYEEDCKTPDSGPVPVCDYDRVMHCKSGGKCDCFSGYFYDKVNKTCISSEEYVKNYPEETIGM